MDSTFCVVGKEKVLFENAQWKILTKSINKWTIYRQGFFFSHDTLEVMSSYLVCTVTILALVRCTRKSERPSMDASMDASMILAQRPEDSYQARGYITLLGLVTLVVDHSFIASYYHHLPRYGLVPSTVLVSLPIFLEIPAASGRAYEFLSQCCIVDYRI